MVLSHATISELLSPLTAQGGVAPQKQPISNHHSVAACKLYNNCVDTLESSHILHPADEKFRRSGTGNAYSPPKSF